MENLKVTGEVLPDPTMEVLRAELAKIAILDINPNIILGEN